MYRGYYHTIAIQSNGTLWAWGTNTEGQLGMYTVYTYPRDNVLGTVANNWIDVSTSSRNFLLLDRGFQIWGVGNNSLGALGNGVNGQLTGGPTTVPYSGGINIPIKIITRGLSSAVIVK
jgi:alpha-tubulin suppressor-like RCC1 family protein